MKSLLYLLILANLTITNALAQMKTLPTIRVKGNTLVMYMDGQRDSFNGVSYIPNPFSYSFGLEKNAVPFCLVSETDSIAMTLRYGLPTDFQIIRTDKGDTVICNFTSHKQVKAAVFSDAYKKANEGKTMIEVPEVYELINVVFALTEYGKTEAIYKETPYYPAMMARFSAYKNHRAVRVIDSVLAKSGADYFNLKMDSYAYQFVGNDIRKGAVYDRVSWGETNTLDQYIPLLTQFARQSNFRAFYQKQLPYYASLVTDFRQNVGVSTMKNWLEKQFPATHYSAVKVIFSPLVGWNQSANNFSDNGFTEAQAHVDYPFVDADQKKQPAAITRGQRMKIVFTELNHSYLNPEAEKYNQQVSAAFADLSKWTTPKTPSMNYNNSLSCFEEYMNYALVTLLYHDLFDLKTFETLRANLEKGMTTSRGFRRFAEFDQELLRLYQTKKPGQTVADLYPAILVWAAR
jgi:Domain of unknown function (DUF4932)